MSAPHGENPTDNRTFAIIPAAGKSRRMGQPKLLLPWHGRMLIDSVLEAWTASDVWQTLVVVRRDDVALRAACERWPVEVVLPDNEPPDMKASLRCGLRYITRRFSPIDSDHWITAPADLPRIGAQLIDRILEMSRKHSDNIVAPKFADRVGHPVLFPWRFATGVFQLGADEGINLLLESESVRYVPLPAEDRLADVDTPEDYERLQ